MPEHDAASVSPLMVPAPHFDVREFARTANGNHRGELDLEAYAQRPLTDDTIRVLAYLHNIERATMSHLRAVLVTAMHKDARITAFLTTWAFEKYWIADALEAIVTAHDPDERSLKEGDKHPSTIRQSIVGNIIGVPMIGVHVTFCTVDEWVMQAAYRRVVELDPHPQLRALFDGFLRIKSRHLDFLEAQARFRLTESPRVRRLTRSRLKRAQWPIGAATEPASETSFFYSHLFSTAPDVVTDLDEQVDSLPGQEGLSLISKAVNR